MSLNNDVSIVLCGEAGQGIQTVEDLLIQVLKLGGYHVFASREYMSRIRGGSNSTEIRVSSQRVSAFVNRIDLLFVFSKGAINHLAKRITSNTLILGEAENLTGGHPAATVEIPFTQIAIEIGNRIYANTVAFGVTAGLFQIEPEVIERYLSRYFAGKAEDIIANNWRAAQRGYEIGQELLRSGRVHLEIPKNASIAKELLLSGTQSVALGAIAGGCNFISSYPMSPSTGVLVFLAQHGGEFGIVVEQAEDEIAAINMALGAWYAGARALVTTSGGGFALMEEGISLAGVQETPVVIHLAQRPGPATGLPTRTEQGDLELALHAGHGEFPRILLAPGRVEDGFYLTQRAFNLAAKYQVPVIVLTDHYFVDSTYNIPSLDLDGLQVEKGIVPADTTYRRYAITESGISPRSVPGFGTGLVAADCHEHTEDGHITERQDVRTQMVNKRLRKLRGITEEALPPQLIGNRDYKALLIAWGSNYHTVREAMEKAGRDDLAFLHFRQVYPLHPDTAAYLRRANKRVIIENNATAQFGKLLQLHTGMAMDERILKYDGSPFAVEELADALRAI